VARADQRCLAFQRCALAAVAAERHRRERGAWPESLEALVKTGHLKEVPADPYDGKALRWCRLKDGAVIYSVGPDGVDNGGTLNRQDITAPDIDFGVRLWDPAARRQPPAPRPAVAPPGPRDDDPDAPPAPREGER
jgi:hypothetical protein